MRIIVYLFILELCFGLNGKLLVIRGISVRHWLFAITLVCVCAKAIKCLVTKWENVGKEKKSVGDFIIGEIKTFKKFDAVLLAFMLLHIVWIIIIPSMQLSRNPEALRRGVTSGLSTAIMALYFPSVYLLRNGQVSWGKYRKFVKGCFVAVAVLHVILYVLEKLQWDYDHSVYFMERVFSWWEDLVGGNCQLPRIMMPKYAVRIIYTFNVCILMSFYFIIGKKEKRYFLWMVLEIVALLTTGTRSMILGAVMGVAVFYMLEFLLHGLEGKKIKELIIRCSLIIIIAVAIDFALFQGMNTTRLEASFSVSEDVLAQGKVQQLEWTSSEYSTENELRGTTNSNTTRILQVKELWGKFQEKPLFGHGFEFGVYDMQGVAYLAKTGLVGIFAWVIFLAVLLKRIICMEKKQKGSALSAAFLVAAVLIDVMLQSVFGSLVMSMAVFLFLDLEEKEQNYFSSREVPPNENRK